MQHQVQPDYRATEDLCLALQAESILIERIPGKSTIGIEVPNDKAADDCAAGYHRAPESINSRAS